MSQSTRTAATPHPQSADNRQLKRGAIGVLGILFFVLSAQAPLTGIGGALPLAVALGNGAGAPAAYLVVGLVIALFAVGFIAMSRHVTEEGAFYAYIGRGLGRRLGTGSALLALWSYNTIQACMYGLYGFIVSFLADTYLGFAPPWWVCALVTMAVVQVLGSLNIDLGARFLGVLVAAEMSILLAFALVTLFTGGGPEGLNPGASFTPSALLAGAPGIALTFGIASMFGFESTAIYSAEAKDPARTVPRATYLAVASIALFFAFVSWMVVSSLRRRPGRRRRRRSAGVRRRHGPAVRRHRRRDRPLGGRGRRRPPGDVPARRDPRLPQRLQPLRALARADRGPALRRRPHDAPGCAVRRQRPADRAGAPPGHAVRGPGHGPGPHAVRLVQRRRGARPGRPLLPHVDLGGRLLPAHPPGHPARGTRSSPRPSPRC